MPPATLPLRHSFPTREIAADDDILMKFPLLARSRGIRISRATFADWQKRVISARRRTPRRDAIPSQ